PESRGWTRHFWNWTLEDRGQHERPSAREVPGWRSSPMQERAVPVSTATVLTEVRSDSRSSTLALEPVVSSLVCSYRDSFLLRPACCREQYLQGIQFTDRDGQI